jgi:ribonuclease P protein subunit RPR2
MQRDSNRKIALERIDILFELAEKAEDKLADRYVYLARKIAMRYNLKFPRSLKQKFCHHCYIYFKPKRVTVRTSTKNKAIEYTCSECDKITRYGYQRKKNK